MKPFHICFICFLLLPLEAGCKRLSLPPDATLPSVAAQRHQGGDDVHVKPKLVEEEFTVEGIARDDGAAMPIVPFANIHLVMTFRLDDPALEETLLAIPVINLTRTDYIRHPATQKMGFVDVIYNQAGAKKSRDGNRITLDVVMRAPSKSGIFRAEVTDGLNPKSKLASNLLVVEEPQKKD